MNKTITINLAGIVFNIDDNAYDVLRVYLEKLNAHFAGPSGKEVLNDIEARVAEMFSQKLTTNKNVIVLDDVNEVIAVMGTPEAIAGSANEPSATNATSETYYKTGRKRVYRNPDDKVLGGVCSGIAAYFDVDPIWLRLAFVVAVIFAGSGLLLYVVLWIIIPEAKTASDKLEMRGEAVNVSNIERNVRAEMEGVQQNLKGRWDKDGQRIMGTATDFVGNMLRYIGRFIVTILGILVSAISIVILIGLTVGMFVFLGWIPADDFPADHIGYFLEPSQLWLLMVGGFLVVGIPVLVLLLNGIKLIFRLNLSLKKTGAVMLGLWFIGIGLCVWQGLNVGRLYHSKVTVSQTERLKTDTTKTLILEANHIAGGRFRFTNRDNGIHMSMDDKPLVFTANDDTVWCSDVRLDIDQSRNDSVYLVTTYSARGINPAEARSTAKAIDYDYRQQDSAVFFNNAFNLNHDKYRTQEVSLTLKIPVGFKVVLDRSLGNVVYDIDNVTNVLDEDMLGHTWTMTENGLECTDCSPDEKQKEIIIPDDESNHKKKRHKEIKITTDL